MRYSRPSGRIDRLDPQPQPDEAQVPCEVMLVVPHILQYQPSGRRSRIGRVG